jgi:hypothetical protein
MGVVVVVANQDRRRPTPHRLGTPRDVGGGPVESQHALGLCVPTRELREAFPERNEFRHVLAKLLA